MRPVNRRATAQKRQLVLVQWREIGDSSPRNANCCSLAAPTHIQGWPRVGRALLMKQAGEVAGYELDAIKVYQRIGVRYLRVAELLRRRAMC
jgi:hypothetical protein